MRYILILLLAAGCVAESADTTGTRQATGSEFSWVGGVRRTSLSVPDFTANGCSGAFMRHGLFITAKHCVEDYPLDLWELSLVFVHDGKFDSDSPLAVDADEIDAIISDPHSDIAAITYNPEITEHLFEIPEIRLATGPPDDTDSLLLIGIPDPTRYDENLERVRLLASDCYTTGRVDTYRTYEHHGRQYETTCPGWGGVSGAPFLTPDGDGYLFYGVGSHGLTDDDKPSKADAFGPICATTFSPVFLSQVFSALF